MSISLLPSFRNATGNGLDENYLAFHPSHEAPSIAHSVIRPHFHDSCASPSPTLPTYPSQWLIILASVALSSQLAPRDMRLHLFRLIRFGTSNNEPHNFLLALHRSVFTRNSCDTGPSRQHSYIHCHFFVLLVTWHGKRHGWGYSVFNMASNGSAAGTWK